MLPCALLAHRQLPDAYDAQGGRAQSRRSTEGGMTTIRCERFKVMCDSSVASCEQCVIRTWALEREAERARVEARRRARVERGGEPYGSTEVRR